MTTVIVHSGACGFSATITAEKQPGGKIALTFDTPCEMVRNMSADLSLLDKFASLAGFQNNPVFRSASQHLKHAACPVPSGILKAVEVEAGLNVTKDASITFIKKGS